jgi:hypothetical protein
MPYSFAAVGLSLLLNVNMRKIDTILDPTTKNTNMAMSNGLILLVSSSCFTAFPTGTFPRFVTLPAYLSLRLRIFLGAGFDILQM